MSFFPVAAIMCVLHVQYCPDCLDKYTILQYTEACLLYYNGGQYCQDINDQVELIVCENCQIKSQNKKV